MVSRRRGRGKRTIIINPKNIMIDSLCCVLVIFTQEIHSETINRFFPHFILHVVIDRSKLVIRSYIIIIMMEFNLFIYLYNLREKNFIFHYILIINARSIIIDILLFVVLITCFFLCAQRLTTHRNVLQNFFVSKNYLFFSVNLYKFFLYCGCLLFNFVFHLI